MTPIQLHRRASILEGMVITGVLALPMWISTPRLIVIHRVRQVSRLPLSWSACVLQAEEHSARFGAESTEEYTIALALDDVASVSQAAGAQGYHKLGSAAHAPQPLATDTVGWVREKGSLDADFSRILVDEVRKTVRAQIVIR